jgi:hypothetical protein
MSAAARKPNPYDRPVTYQICVRGMINENWSDRLEGMTISHRAAEDGDVITTLEGELRDQAALAGVLNSIYERHLQLLSVNWMDSRLHNQVKE